MRPSLRLALAFALLTSGCLVEPVDFTGKTCRVGGTDCPEGLECHPATRKCVATASGLDASLGHLDAGLDAGLARDAAGPTDVDADLEPGDAQAIEPDAGARLDGSLGEDSGPVGSDASVPADVGLPPSDAAEPAGPDAAAPGLDAASPGPDASSCGYAIGAPLLQRVGPAAVPAGSSDLTLTLSGENFDSCAEVRIGGLPVTVLSSGPTDLKVTVPKAMLAEPGLLPVQVVNVYRGLEYASNPNTVLLGSKTQSGNPVPIGAAVLDTGELAVAFYSNKTIGIFDGETLAGPSKTFSTSNQPETLAYGGKKLWYLNNNRLMVVEDPLGAATTRTLSLDNDSVALDVDDAQGTLLVAESSAKYQTVDLLTEAVSASQQVGSGFLASFVGAGLDVSRKLAVFPLMTGATKLVTVGTSTPAYTIDKVSGSAVAVDRAAGVAYLGGSTALFRVALSGTALPSIAAPLPMRMLRHNPLSRRLVATPSGETDLSYSLALVDEEAEAVAGFIGAGSQRGCGPSGSNNSARVEGLAIDPKHNRAYVTSSCDDTLEAYNLNVLMVTLPAPTIASFSPSSRSASSTSFTLKILGTGFHSTAKVTYGGAIVPILSVTPTELVVTAPGSTCGGNKSVVVANTDPARGTDSQSFPVTMGTPSVSGASISGCTCTDGACSTCTVTATGSGFTSGCSVLHVGTDTATGTGSSGVLSATFSLCAGAVGSGTECGMQTLDVYVSNPGGGTSGTAKVVY